MSRIDELIRDLCPNGVEVKTLGEVGEFIRGNGLQKADLRDAGFPAVHYGQIHTHYGVWATKTKSFTDENIAVKLRHARPGDLLIATTSEDDDAVAKATAWLGDTDVAVSGDAYIYRHELEPKYVSYFFQSTSFQDQKRRFISGTKVRRVSGDSLAKIRIPVPPLEVQREIVRVLDQFTQLEAELEAELEARRRQYQHYRDTLCSSPGASFASLGSLGELFGGLSGKTKADFAEGNARFVSYVNVFRNIAVDVAAKDFVRIGEGERQRSLRFGDVLFTGSSESAAEVGMTSVVTQHLDETLYLNSFCIGFRPHDVERLSPHYAKHLFRSSAMRSQIVRTANGVTRFNVSKGRLAQILVPLPTRDEQDRIARTLDAFESLVNSLTDGLPAEIAARRKQYAYYRDRLLSFEEAAA